MSDMKNLIIKEMDLGKDTLNAIDVLRKAGKDYTINSTSHSEVIDRYHPDFLYLKVVEIIKENKDVKTFRLASTKGALPAFQSGQYINIFVNIDGTLTSRPYSISSSNRQTGHLDVTIQRVDGGFVSNYFIDHVKVGDKFETTAPAGHFHYNPVFHSKKVVFIAGGSGITPFLSMSREVLYSGLDREITLIYGCRNQESILFYDELLSMQANYPNFNLKVVLSEPNAGYSGLTGFINKDIIKEGLGDLNDYSFYVCGPQVMNEAVKNQLEELGVRGKNVKIEMSGSTKDVSKEPNYPEHIKPTDTFTVTVNGSKKIKAAANESLLTSLERANIEVKNVSCRSGECSLCRLKLEDGNVFMPKEALMRHADEKYSYIHSCKAFPLSDLKIKL